MTAQDKKIPPFHSGILEAQPGLTGKFFWASPCGILGETPSVTPGAVEGVSEGGYCLWEPLCGRPWVSGPLGGARGGLVPGGHRPGPTEAAAETGAPPRRRGYGGVLSPVGGIQRGGLPPFENITPGQLPTPVSPAGSGPAPRWGASRTDRSGNGDRFAAERHRRSLTPSRAHTFVKERAALGREGETILYISFQRGRCPL